MIDERRVLTSLDRDQGVPGLGPGPSAIREICHQPGHEAGWPHWPQLQVLPDGQRKEAFCGEPGQEGGRETQGNQEGEGLQDQEGTRTQTDCFRSRTLTDHLTPILFK
jgi:hypothetical protein